MQVVVKAKPEFQNGIVDLLSTGVSQALPGGTHSPIRITKVFPELSKGNRSRLYAVHLPDDLAKDDVDRVVLQLRRQESLEYAEIPAPRREIHSE
jgi:hypothetical protein